MNWKQWLGYDLYKKLWSLIGKRKWTFIMRDFAYLNPMLMFFLGIGIGIWLHSWLEWRDLVIGGACLLLSHLFWGTKFKKGQGLEK